MPRRRVLRLSAAAGAAKLPSLGLLWIRNRTVAHDDLWTEHVLFTADGRLSAIIDLDGLDDGHGDLSALLSDFVNLAPELRATWFMDIEPNVSRQARTC